MMKLWPLGCVLVLSALLTSRAEAGQSSALHSAARQKPGPVTLRGVAHRVRSTGFELQTSTRGTFTVDASPPTKIVEKGKSGRLAVAEGDHLGVRGYVKGRSIRAIEVRIYPVKPKPFSVQGTIIRIAGTQLQLRTAGATATIVLNHATVIRSATAMLGPADLRVGQRVEVREVASGRTLVALHIHVYGAKAPARHVRLSGTVATASGNSVVVVASGTRYTVALAGSTRYYAGNAQTTSAPRTGAQVTVYACCAGGPLTAVSIHMRVTKAATHTIELRGTVTAVSAGTLRLDTPHAPPVALGAATVYELGSKRIARGDVRVGDAVSVRGTLSGGVLQALRVHVYASSRATTTIQGTVTGVSGSSVRILARGTTYLVSLGKGSVAHLAGKVVAVALLRSGDRARASGHLTGHALLASTLDVTRPSVKVVTVHGTVTAVGSTWLVITRSTGATVTVRLNVHTTLTLAGRPAGVSALFPGVRATARGTRPGSELLASSVIATARSATVAGRFIRLAGHALLVERSTGTSMRIDLPAGVTPRDGAHSVSPARIGPGAYLHAVGYYESAAAMRALAVTVLHPSLDLHGVLGRQGSAAIVQLSSGAVYRMTFVATSTITAEHVDGSLRLADLPNGAAVQVVGTVATSGDLTVVSVVARLHSITLRGKIASLDAGTLSLTGGASPVTARLTAGTTLAQGSRPITLADLVVGDDVTVYGYALNGSALVARKLAVHRRLLGIDGTVASIAGQTFVLTAADGPHTVLVGGTTEVIGVAGTVLGPGMTVHVTGYLRGDGSILATKVRILKAT